MKRLYQFITLQSHYTHVMILLQSRSYLEMERLYQYITLISHYTQIMILLQSASIIVGITLLSVKITLHHY